MMPDVGIEPPTFGLQNRCTTAVLIRHVRVGRGAPYYQMMPNVQPSVAAIFRSSGAGFHRPGRGAMRRRSEEHTSELQSLMSISYAVFCLKKKNIAENKKQNNDHEHT